MPLSGLRVLDLSGAAGAFGGRLLAGLGAEVLRPRERIEATEARFGRAGRVYYEAGKVPLAYGVSTARAELLRGVDVVIEESSASPRCVPDSGQPAAESGSKHGDAGLHSQAASAPIRLEISPFGQTGARRGWSGSDLVCAARGGMVFVNGHPGSAPLQPFGPQAYHATGIWGVLGVLLALQAQRRGGPHAVIDLSVQAATAAAVEHVTGLRRQGRGIQRRQGTLHWSRVFRAGETRDGWVLHTLAGDWQTLSLWVHDESGQHELLDSALEEVDTRRERCEELFDRLDRWGQAKTAAQIEEEGQLRRLTFAEVRPPERLATDPQLRARGFRGSQGGSASPGAPFVLSETPFRPAGELPEATAPAPAPDAIRSAGGQPTTPRGEQPGAPRSANGAAMPLAGIRVLDFTWVVAGPVATRILADHGAEVLKIEHPLSPDFGTRRGGLTGNLNRGKKSLVLDMEKPEAREIALELVDACDIVIDNFSARVMQNWGLDYESVQARNPAAIQVRLSGFGLDGPERDRVSYGPTLQAMAGLAHLMRHPGGPPAGWGYSWSDMVGGLMGALATLAALENRDRTGRGQLVDVGQYGNLVSLLGPGLLELLAGRSVDAPGNRSQEGAGVPHGIWRAADEARADGGAADRWVAISVLDEAAWEALARVLAEDGEHWAGEARWQTLDGRERDAAELEDRLGAWVRPQKAEAVEARLQAAGVPAGLVADGDDLAGDAQLGERGYFPRVTTPEGDEEVFDGIPFLTTGLSGGVRAPGPLRGEQGEQVLRDVLGMDDARIEGLRREGVIG